MSSSTSPASRSNDTRASDYSPELVRTAKSHHVSNLSDPFGIDPLSSHPESFGAVMTRTVSMSFGETKSAGRHTCFLYVGGQQQLADYMNGGVLSFVRTLVSFIGIHSRNEGKEIFVRYGDARDAQKAIELLRQYRAGDLSAGIMLMRIVCITAKEYCDSTSDFPNPLEMIELGRTFTTGFDGQLVCRLDVTEQKEQQLQQKAEHAVKELLGDYAPIHKLKTFFVDAKTGTVLMLLQLHEHEKADNIVKFFRRHGDGLMGSVGRMVADFATETTLQKPNIVAPETLSTFNDSPFGIGGRYFEEEEYAIPNDFLHRNTMHAGSLFGIIGQNRPTSSNGIMPFDLTPNTRFGMESMRRENKNYVDIEKVRMGLDVRTTVMLRNVPNRITQSNLKECLDKYVARRYDFMYLRIDFGNDCKQVAPPSHQQDMTDCCSVGYAFVNFVTAEDVAEFVRCIAGKKWIGSDKIAEVSYATMQGRETLVSKFRNSSIMNEAPSSRPKLYYAGAHVLAGYEEEFPKSDNSVKLARSNENAAHIGLFSPGRGGGHYAGMDRRRRGLYDRGTTFADYERLRAENAMLRELALREMLRCGIGPAFY